MGCVGGVEVGGWQEFGFLVCSESHGPACTFVVDEAVVVSAEGDGVVAVGGSAVLPGDDVVNLGPPWRFVAAGERTAAVAEQHGVAGGAGE